MKKNNYSSIESIISISKKGGMYILVDDENRENEGDLVFSASDVNAEKINLSGNKWDSKQYIRYTGYPGGQKSLTAKELFAKDPARLIEKSIKGMLPKNKLGAQIFRNLKVYVGENHKQEGQNPIAINLNELK